MFSHLIRLFFLFAAAAAVPNVANYAPLPIVTPAPSSYGSPYGQSNQGAIRLEETDNYGVPELLPVVAQVTNTPRPFVPQPVPQPIPPPPFQPPPIQQPLAVTVPVPQPVGFSQQVTVTNPQAVSQGYAPPPQIPPAPSAYGAPSSAYGSIPNVQNQQQLQLQEFNVPNNVQQAPFERLPASQSFSPNVGVISGVAGPNGIAEAEDNLDVWSEGGHAQGVKTKKSRIPRVRIH